MESRVHIGEPPIHTLVFTLIPVIVDWHMVPNNYVKVLVVLILSSYISSLTLFRFTDVSFDADTTREFLCAEWHIPLELCMKFCGYLEVNRGLLVWLNEQGLNKFAELYMAVLGWTMLNWHLYSTSIALLFCFCRLQLDYGTHLLLWFDVLMKWLWRLV